ncbi:MAG: ATP-binding cassette domain-containing protein [Proteobacteria bacterium]|nr:ATP-binding cassette domain-containing protein [Pseudomonadota bacterium]
MPLIQVEQLKNVLGGQSVHSDVNFVINKGETVAIVGGSGSGKTTILRCLLMLLRPTAGKIRMFDIDILHCSEADISAVRRRCGVTFQQGALFSGLTVLQNVMFPLNEMTDLSHALQKEIALLKIVLAGLPSDAANKYPAELSGGMLKRAALARAIALDPEVLFLDEPTSGLDPKSASGFDQLILYLRQTLGLTMVIVTHDVDTLWQVTDRVLFLGEGQVLAALPMRELVKHPHPEIQEFFKGPRGRLKEYE